MTATVPVFHHDTIDSTNLEAHRLVKSGMTADAWIRADEQTRGRGRSDHRWISEPGNLYATRLLKPHCDVATVAQISLVAAVAVHDVVCKWIALEKVALKWPNDCLVDDSKISGILVETCPSADLCVAIGCGINVAHAPRGLAYPTTHIRNHHLDVSVDAVFRALADSLELRLSQWDSGRNFLVIKREWLQRAYPLGTQVKVSGGQGLVAGAFAGMADDGALLVELGAGQVQRIYAGDVSIAGAA